MKLVQMALLAVMLIVTSVAAGTNLAFKYQSPDGSIILSDQALARFWLRGRTGIFASNVQVGLIVEGQFPPPGLWPRPG